MVFERAHTHAFKVSFWFIDIDKFLTYMKYFYFMSLILAKLEKKTALQILVYLYKKQELANREDLKSNIKGVMETIYSAIEILKSLDLIEEDEGGVFPFVRRAGLKEKGILVAKRLVEIEDVLKTTE